MIKRNGSGSLLGVLVALVVLGATVEAKAQTAASVGTQSADAWCVFQKTSSGPLCSISSRRDWLTVAHCHDPVAAFGNPCGLQLIPENMPDMDWATAWRLRDYVAVLSPRFDDFCGKDYVRWFSATDRTRLICVDRLASPGPGWFMDTPNALGCLDACGAYSGWPIVVPLVSQPGQAAVWTSRDRGWRPASGPGPLILTAPGQPPISLSVSQAATPPTPPRRPPPVLSSAPNPIDERTPALPPRPGIAGTASGGSRAVTPAEIEARIRESVRAALPSLPYFGLSNLSLNPSELRRIEPLRSGYRVKNAAGAIPVSYDKPFDIDFGVNWEVNVKTWVRTAAEVAASYSSDRQCGGKPDWVYRYDVLGANSCASSAVGGGRPYGSGGVVWVATPCANVRADVSFYIYSPDFRNDSPDVMKAMHASAEKVVLDVGRILRDAVERGCPQGAAPPGAAPQAASPSVAGTVSARPGPPTGIAPPPNPQGRPIDPSTPVVRPPVPTAAAPAPGSAASASSVRLTTAQLADRTFLFNWNTSRAGGFNGRVTLQKDGKITGANSANEFSWLVDDQGRLVFRHQDGRVSTIFDTSEYRYGRRILSGPFLLREGVRHSIEEVEK